ncbi:SRPBCC family protein [Jeotgalibacillus sp. R-1-5s-1]|uniref:SRPBCC family protein n=1 Tax=Jeotgalibacillus sp. R-1-5s-1 TaxID=2555897 RepID=UPI00106C5A4F|nr:SRPBCC family protein [Jeotgalibacillus sp. R-1-5s-1]TFE01819.1 SRPBCC family protein [Jeotgalibacillus sp. R-1-5s-1]
MGEWTKGIEIKAPIDFVWKYFNGSDKDMKKIMPQVVENVEIKKTEDGKGSVYRQKYKEGKRVMEYDVETLNLEDGEDKKLLKVGFTLGSMFEITALYELIKIDEETTYFRYTTTNEPLKWYVRMFLLFASDRSVSKFIQRVKFVAEEEYEDSKEETYR